MLMSIERSWQILIKDYDDLARDAPISPATAKEWVSLLEDSFLVRLIHPHHSNRTKRLIKSPKHSRVGGGALSEDWRIASPLDLEFLEMS